MAKDPIPNRRRLVVLCAGAVTSMLLLHGTGCTQTRPIAIRLIFKAMDTPTIFNYYTDERDRDRSRSVGIFVGAGTSAELGFVPSGGRSIPEWIVVEWLYPIAEGGRSREENTANATRHLRRFVLKDVMPDTLFDELQQIPNRLLEISFVFRMSEATMNWRVQRM